MKHERFTPTGCRDIGIRKFEFVAKTQILWSQVDYDPSYQANKGFLLKQTSLSDIKQLKIEFFKKIYILLISGNYGWGRSDS